MEEVFTLLDTIAPLEADLRGFLADSLKPFHYKKGEMLVKEGSIARYLGYIEQGLIRGYRLDEKNHEYTSWLMREGDVYASVRSFFRQKAATETVEALEPTTVLCLSHEAYAEALRRWPSFHRHRAELLEKYYLHADEREEMRQQDGLARLRFLREHYPDLEKRVEDKYLASFLSLTPQHYSTLKSQYAKLYSRR